MLMLDRDRLIVLSIGRFKLLTSSHLRQMHFSELASDTPLKRALIRLRGSGHIKVLERRPVGGNGAGSGQFVYQLGRAGHALSRRPGSYWALRSIDHHTLTIADAYVELLTLEQAGKIQILTYETEPDTWRTVGEIALRPDFYVELRKGWEDKIHRYWIEVDMGTERREKIVAKLVDYYNADVMRAEGSAQLPTVVFIAPDDRRASELRHWIEQGRQDAQKLFVVTTMPEFAGLLFG